MQLIDFKPMKPLPSYRQLDAMDCGPTCLRMISKYYGRNFSVQSLREKSSLRAKAYPCWVSAMRPSQ